MAQHDVQYLNLVEHVLNNGTLKTDRTGVGTISVMSQQMRFDLSDGSIPLLTSKKMFTRGALHEIVWYWRGMTNIKYLLDNNVHIWDEWADENGDLGPVYGAMWRAWPDIQIAINDAQQADLEQRGYEFIAQADRGYNDMRFMRKTIDQLGDAIELLKNSPDSRRIIINSWNPALLPTDMKNPSANPAKGLQALPPCHCMFQFYVVDGKLSCDLRQRSADIGLGVPFNIAQYSIMTHIIAKMVGLQPGEFVWNGVDCHIYTNHIEQLKLQLSRRNGAIELPQSPTVKISDRVVGLSPEEVEVTDVEVVGYDTPYGILKMEVAI